VVLRTYDEIPDCMATVLCGTWLFVILFVWGIMVHHLILFWGMLLSQTKCYHQIINFPPSLLLQFLLGAGRTKQSLNNLIVVIYDLDLDNTN